MSFPINWYQNATFRDSQTQTGDTEQLINITDLICEGPIKGFVKEEAGVYLNDSPAIDADFEGSYSIDGTSTAVRPTLTFSGTNVGTSATGFQISETAEVENRVLQLENYLSASVSTTFTGGIVYGTSYVNIGWAGGSFDTAWDTNGSNNTRRATLRASGREFSGSFESLSATTGVFRYSGNFNDSGYDSSQTYTLEIKEAFLIESIDVVSSSITLKNNVIPTSGTYTFKILAEGTIEATGYVPGAWNSYNKVDNFSVQFVDGSLYQNALEEVNGVGGSVSVNGNLGAAGFITELKQLQQGKATELGITLKDPEGYPTGQSSNVNGAADVTKLTTSVLGLDSAAKIAEADEINFTIQYPAFQTIKTTNGNKEYAYAYYEMRILIDKDGTGLETWSEGRNVFANYGNHVIHQGNTTAPVSFQHIIGLNQFRPFVNFEVHIARTTRHSGLRVTSDGTSAGKTDKDKWQLSAQAQITAAGAIIRDKFRYPYSSIASVTFSSKKYRGVPKRSYLVEGLKVQIPDTYTPREYSDTGVAKYEGFWGGGFKDELYYTDNPAWVFYDIVTNNRYGAGQWIKSTDIDKYALYRIAKYCDELVPDGKGGTGTEPRFRSNLFLTKSTDVYKVLKDIASMFTGMLYWMDGQLTVIQDTPSDPVYTFTKGNVIGGQFGYESTGTKTRANQIIVTWNDPTINYEPVPLIVEDSEDIVRRGRIISQTAVAFGATSEGQAIRYGRWKLWTALNQTEIVSFKTGLQGNYVRPGDIINVQDADRTSIPYSGRVSSYTPGALVLDREVLFNTGSTYSLSTLVTEPAAFYAGYEPVTINSVTYNRGERITSAYVDADESGAGTTLALTALTTEARASNAFANIAGTQPLEITWSDYTYVQTQAITNPASLTNTLAVTTDVAVTSETIWALTEVSDSLEALGSAKKYRVLSLSKEGQTEFGITAVEYYDEKFDAVDTDYELGTIPDSIYVEQEPATVPAPSNIYAVLEDDATTPGKDLVVSWDRPPNYDFVSGYEILHSVAGLDNPLSVTGDSYTFKDLPSTIFTFRVRTVSSKGNKSKYTSLNYDLQEEFSGNIERVQEGIPKGLISNSTLVRNGSNVLTFEGIPSAIVSTGSSLTSAISTSGLTPNTIDVSGLPVNGDVDYYVLLANNALQLAYYDTQTLSNLPYWRVIPAGDTVLSAQDSVTWTSTGTGVSAAVDSNIINGVGTTWLADLKPRDIVMFGTNISNALTGGYAAGSFVVGASYVINTVGDTNFTLIGASSNTIGTIFTATGIGTGTGTATLSTGGLAAKVTSIISDTQISIDRTFSVPISSTEIFRRAYRVDTENDAIFARITKSGASAYNLVKYITIDSDLISTAVQPTDNISVLNNDSQFTANESGFLNQSPFFAIDAAWTGNTANWQIVDDLLVVSSDLNDPTQVAADLVNASPTGRTTGIRITNNNDDTSDDVFSEFFSIEPTKSYKITVWVRQTSGDRKNYLSINFCDGVGRRINNTYTGANATGFSVGTYSYWQVSNQAFPSTWTKYELYFGKDFQFSAPTDATKAAIGWLGSRVGTTATTIEFAQYSIEEIPSVQTGQFFFTASGNADAPTAGAFAAQVGRPPIIGDIVSVQNITPTPSTASIYIRQRSSWAVQDAYIAGNLLVDGTITADKIDVSGVITVGKIASGESLNEASSVNYNPNLSLVASDGRPAGVKAVYSNTTPGSISYQDVAKSILKLYSATDIGIGAGWPAFRLNPDVQYNITIRWKMSAAVTSGVYFRIQEYNGAALPVGKTHISASGGEAGVQAASQQVTGFKENQALGNTFVEETFVYTPTSTAKWASAIVLNWDGAGNNELHIDSLHITEDSSIKRQGSIGGITIAADKLYEGAGNFSNSDTGFYLDDTGQFSLKDQLNFNPTTSKLTVKGEIGATELNVEGDLVVVGANVATGAKVSSITYDMLAPAAIDRIHQEIGVASGTGSGDFKENSAQILNNASIVLSAFTHGTNNINLVLSASISGIQNTLYSGGLRASYVIYRKLTSELDTEYASFASGFMDTTQTSLNAAYVSGYLHILDFSVEVTDNPSSSGDYDYKVVFLPVGSFYTNVAVSANFSANEAPATVSAGSASALPLAGGAMTGPITTNSTFDGVDVATRDAVLTSTTTTANAALPKAGGTMSGELKVHAPLTIRNPTTTGHVEIGTIANDQENDFVRGSIIMSRDEDQITYNTATDLWVHAGGSSTDWSMISHTSGGSNFYTGPTLASATTYTNTAFNAAYQWLHVPTSTRIANFKVRPTVTGNNIWHAGDFANNSTNWNTAYTYSQVGHVELDGTSIISGNSAVNGTRTPILWMRGRVGDSVSQINVNGPNIEFGQSGTLDATPAFTFSNSGGLTVSSPDGGSSPAMTAIIDLEGYGGRGAGIKIRDSVNSAAGASNREWFIGSGYNQSGFNIGYSAAGSQSSYLAQNKLSIDTSGNVIAAGTVTATGGTLTGGLTATTGTFSGTLQAPSLRIASGGVLLDTQEGVEYKYYLVGSSVADNLWKKVCDVAVATGLFKALTMKITLESQASNFGNSASVETSEFTAAYSRSAQVQDDNNNATLVGQNTENHQLRIIKTATGAYELQILMVADYKDAFVKIEVLSTNGGTVTMASSVVSGSTVGNIYLATYSGVTKNLFNKVDIGNGLDVTGTVTSDGLTVSSTDGSSITQTHTDGNVVNFTQTGTGGTIEWRNANGEALIRTGDSSRLLVGSNGDVSFYEDTGVNARFFWDASAERLGLGTTSPSGPLHIATDDSAISRIVGTNASGTNFGIGNTSTGPAQLLLDGSNGDFLGADYLTLRQNNDLTGELVAVGANALLFSTNSAERMRIDSTGKVGIGTESPQYKFVVSNANNESIEFAPGIVAGVNGTLHYDRTGAAYVVNRTYAASHEWRNGSSVEVMAIDTLGNALFNCTTADPAGTSVIGTALLQFGGASMSRNNTPALDLNRMTSDGEIATFRKDGTTVGSIGTVNDELFIQSGDVGLQFDASGNNILPYGSSAFQNDFVNLGSSAIRFNNIYASKLIAGTSSSTDGSVVLQGFYSNGAIANWGTERSSGGPVMGYGVIPSTVTGGLYVSSTGINIQRGAYVIAGSTHKWSFAGTQTVTENSSVTMTEKMSLDGNALFVNGVGVNATAATDQIRVSGFGIAGNRGTFYVTNNGAVAIGVGGTHSADTSMTFGANINTSHKDLTVAGSVKVSDRMLLQNSVDRAGLLSVEDTTGTSWVGFQAVFDAATEWSVMGNATSFGLYDDGNSKWILNYSENASTYLYHNGSEKFATTSTGVDITGSLAASTDITAPGKVIAGLGSGGVALTVNDGGGNANVTFNHSGQVPEQDGNSARIVVNTDSSTVAKMEFELAEGVTSGASVTTLPILTLEPTGATVTGSVSSSAQGVLWGATNDGANSGLDADLLDGQEGASYLRSDANDTLSSVLKVTGANSNIIYEKDANGGFIPLLAQSVTATNNWTGAIKITFPTHGSADMMSGWVDIYDYTTNESVTIFIGAYLYQTTGNNEWANVTANVITSKFDKAYTVRFGADGSNSCIWIGELASTWNYPQITCRDWTIGFTADIDAYATGTTISFVTAFNTINNTITATLPVASDHLDLSGGVVSPVGAVVGATGNSPIEGQKFKMLANVSHDRGHITGSTILELDFTDSQLTVVGTTAQQGRLDIRADSISASELTISANVDSAANSIYMDDTGVIKIYDGASTLRVKIGKLT